jgi:hypothetical protein
MSENPTIPTAQNTIQDPPEYNAENAKNPKEGSDWLGGPQNGNETPSGSDYTKHRFDETPNVTAGKKTEGAYQTASHSTGWENSETEVKPLEASQKPSSGPETTTGGSYTDKLGGSSDN